jgi:hypothetical protein
MIALAINADPRWFWHGPDARHSGPRSSPDPPDRPDDRLPRQPNDDRQIQMYGE